jgi:O-antigen/teichoic acid export membrane protein
MPQSRRLLGSILAYVSASVGPAIIGMLSAAVFTRRFAASDYGRYSLALTSANLLVLLSTQWLQQATNRYLPGEQSPVALQKWKSAIAASLVLTAIGLATLGAFAASTARFLLEPAWRSFVLPGAVLALATGLTAPLLVVLQAEMRAADYARFRHVAAVSSFVLSFLLVIPPRRDASLLLWGTAIPLLMLVLPLWKSAGLVSPLRLYHLWPDLANALRRMVAYGAPLTGWFLAVTLLFFGDRFVIQLYRGEREVGIYSASYLLVSGSVSLLATPLIVASHPFLVRTWESGDRVAAARWLQIIVELLLIASGVLSVAIGFFASDVSRLMLGISFREGSAIMPVLASAALAWQLAMYVHKPLEFAGRTVQMLLLGVSALVVDVVLNFATVPIFGYRAAAYALLVGSLVYLGLARWSGQRILRWSVRAPLLAAAALLAISSPLLVRFRAWIDLRAGLRAGLAISCAVVFLLVLAGYALARPALREIFLLRRERA